MLMFTYLCRPGALAGLSDASLAYTVEQPAGAAGQPFALTVSRRSNQQPIFDTSGHRYAAQQGLRLASQGHVEFSSSSAGLDSTA